MNYNPLLTSLIEIFDGYTRFDLNGQTLFFKHFTLKDQNTISLSYLKYENIAISKGIETKESIFNRLKKDGVWSEDDELKISELQSYVENLKKTKSKIFLPSQKEKHQELINSEEDKLNSLLTKKQELVSITAEDYANKMANEEFLRNLIFSDSSLKKLQFTEDEFGELSSTDIRKRLQIENNYAKEEDYETPPEAQFSNGLEEKYFLEDGDIWHIVESVDYYY